MTELPQKKELKILSSQILVQFNTYRHDEDHLLSLAGRGLWGKMAIGNPRERREKGFGMNMGISRKKLLCQYLRQIQQVKIQLFLLGDNFI